MEILTKISEFLWNYPFIIFIMLAGVYFTIKSKFFSITHFGHIMKHTLGSLTSKEAHDKKAGQISPFEAVSIAIGGCVGTGNLGGVATAIAVGGPGAVFWMWLWALVGMTVKMVEVTLGCYYRSQNEKGEFYGGSTHVIEKGIGREMGKKFGYPLATIFGVFFLMQCLQGSQAYTVSEVLNTVFGWNMIATTVLYTLIIYYVIWRGVPKIASFASRAVPFMTMTFLIGGLVIIALNIKSIPSVFYSIFHDAFTGSAAIGGFTGSVVAQAIRQGISRSINSNEAGQGASPFIHGSATTVHPVRQGLWGAFEVFIDTLVVCSITALAILSTGSIESGSVGATLTIFAYNSVFGRFGEVFIGIMIILFGVTTTSGWYTYYNAVIQYMFRYKPKLRDAFALIFKIVFPAINIFVVTTIVLQGHGPEMFWTIVDIVIVLPVFFNLLALFILRDKFTDLLKDYKSRYITGKDVDPNFKVFYEDDPEIFKEEEKIREKLRKL